MDSSATMKTRQGNSRDHSLATASAALWNARGAIGSRWLRGVHCSRCSRPRQVFAAKILIATILVCAWHCPPECTADEQGSVAPEFTLRDLSGTPVGLDTCLERGPVLLTFWSSCCSNMHSVMTEMQRLHEAYADSGLTVLGISQDDGRTQSRVRPWVLARRLSFTVLLDSRGEIMRRYGHDEIPAFVLVTPQRRVAWSRRGFAKGTEAAIERVVREQLGLLAAPADSTREEES